MIENILSGEIFYKIESTFSRTYVYAVYYAVTLSLTY